MSDRPTCQNPNGCEAEAPQFTGSRGGDVRCDTCYSYRLQHEGHERPGWLIRHHREARTLLSTPEVVEVSGLTYRQVDHGVRTGVFTPQVIARGSGTARGWTEYEVAGAVAVCWLRDLLGTSAPQVERDVAMAAAEGDRDLYEIGTSSIALSIALDEAHAYVKSRLADRQEVSA